MHKFFVVDEKPASFEPYMSSPNIEMPEMPSAGTVLGVVV
jgi:hypothetical protein